MASTAAILNSEPTNILEEQRHLAGSIPEEAADDLDTSALEAADEGVVGDLGTYMKTHLSRIEFPTVINWMSPFPILGLLGGIFHF